MINKTSFKYIIILILLFNSCKSIDYKTTHTADFINKIIDKWHADARDANFEEFFDRISNKGYYIGTDSSEIWTKQEFANYSKPYFDKNKTWNFKAINRNVYFSKNKKVAWFDELLDTWMGECRGSGVLELENGKWKIKHYVLSITIPNSKVKETVKIKSILYKSTQ